MTQTEIIALVVTFIGVLSFATIITMLYSSYISSVIKDIRLGNQDADFLYDLIKESKAKIQKRRKIISIIKNCAYCIFLAIIIPVISLAVISKVNGDVMMIGGNSVIVVASGSMSEKNSSNNYLFTENLNNQFQTYDIIVINKVNDEADLKKYDVISFINDKGITVIHRIIDFEYQNGERVYVTRGDANNATDKYRPTFDNVIGRYSGKRVPLVGMFVLFFQSGSGIITVVAVIYCLLVIDYLSKKMNKESEKRLEILSSVFNVDEMEDKDIELMKIGYVEYILYKGFMYRLDENGIVDKKEVNENYEDKKILEVVENTELEELRKK